MTGQVIPFADAKAALEARAGRAGKQEMVGGETPDLLTVLRHKYNMAHDLRGYWCSARLLALAEYGEGSEQHKKASYAQEDAEIQLWHAIDRRIRLPAETVGELRWKEQSAGFCGGHPDWQAAIARDTKALAHKIKKRDKRQ